MYGIVACDPKGVIGKKGKLPWHCPEDLAYFSDTTKGHMMVMGYRTFFSLPSHYFEDRMGTVFTRQKPVPDPKPNLIFLSSLEEFFSLLGHLKEQDCYIIGGAEIYRLFLEKNLISEFLVTQFKDFYEGDTFFPLALLQNWPREKMRETDLFILYRYVFPEEKACM